MTVASRWEQIDVGDKTMNVYVAAPHDTGPRPGIVLIQEIFGVNPHIRSVADRWAREGYFVAAPDVFHRQGDRFESGYDNLAPGFERMGKLRDDDFLRDAGALLGWMREQGAVRKDRIGVTGYCMGGRLTAVTAMTLEVQAAVSFYAGGIGQLIDRFPHLKAPILFFFGAQDNFIPVSDTEKVRHALETTKKAGEVVVYDDCGHGFFCEARGSYYKPAADEAWKKATDWFARHLKS
jgi:carboxymethylenebutenolidase